MSLQTLEEQRLTGAGARRPPAPRTPWLGCPWADSPLGSPRRLTLSPKQPDGVWEAPATLRAPAAPFMPWPVFPPSHRRRDLASSGPRAGSGGNSCNGQRRVLGHSASCEDRAHRQIRAGPHAQTNVHHSLPIAPARDRRDHIGTGRGGAAPARQDKPQVRTHWLFPKQLSGLGVPQATLSERTLMCTHCRISPSELFWKLVLGSPVPDPPEAVTQCFGVRGNYAHTERTE